MEYNAILDRTSSEKSVIEAVQQLQTLSESRDFWSDIIRDRTYSPTHRRIALVQYFVRHSFYKMARELRLEYLNLSPFKLDIKVIGLFAGVMPVDDPVENAVVHLTCDFGDAGSAAIYLSIFPKAEDSKLADVLFWRKADSCQVVTDVAAGEQLNSGEYIRWKRWQRGQIYEYLSTP